MTRLRDPWRRACLCLAAIALIVCQPLPARRPVRVVDPPEPEPRVSRTVPVTPPWVWDAKGCLDHGVACLDNALTYPSGTPEHQRFVGLAVDRLAAFLDAFEGGLEGEPAEATPRVLELLRRAAWTLSDPPGIDADGGTVRLLRPLADPWRVVRLTDRLRDRLFDPAHTTRESARAAIETLYYRARALAQTIDPNNPRPGLVEITDTIDALENILRVRGWDRSTLDAVCSTVAHRLGPFVRDWRASDLEALRPEILRWRR